MVAAQPLPPGWSSHRVRSIHHGVQVIPKPSMLDKPDGRFTVSPGIVRLEPVTELNLREVLLREEHGHTLPRPAADNDYFGIRSGAQEAVVRQWVEGSSQCLVLFGNCPRCANAACEAVTGGWWFVRVWHSGSPAVPPVGRGSFPWKLHIGCSPPPRVGT